MEEFAIVFQDRTYMLSNQDIDFLDSNLINTVKQDGNMLPIDNYRNDLFEYILHPVQLCNYKMTIIQLIKVLDMAYYMQISDKIIDYLYKILDMLRYPKACNCANNKNLILQNIKLLYTEKLLLFEKGDDYDIFINPNDEIFDKIIHKQDFFKHEIDTINKLFEVDIQNDKYLEHIKRRIVGTHTTLIKHGYIHIYLINYSHEEIFEILEMCNCSIN
jgi:hypothetical protein